MPAGVSIALSGRKARSMWWRKKVSKASVIPSSSTMDSAFARANSRPDGSCSTAGGTTFTTNALTDASATLRRGSTQHARHLDRHCFGEVLDTGTHDGQDLDVTPQERPHVGVQIGLGKPCRSPRARNQPGGDIGSGCDFVEVQTLPIAPERDGRRQDRELVRFRGDEVIDGHTQGDEILKERKALWCVSSVRIVESGHLKLVRTGRMVLHHTPIIAPSVSSAPMGRSWGETCERPSTTCGQIIPTCETASEPAQALQEEASPVLSTGIGYRGQSALRSGDRYTGSASFIGSRARTIVPNSCPGSLCPH